MASNKRVTFNKIFIIENYLVVPSFGINKKEITVHFGLFSLVGLLFTVTIAQIDFVGIVYWNLRALMSSIAIIRVCCARVSLSI